MKTISLFILSFLISAQINCQTITGKVVDASNGEPLIYASIGIVNVNKGTITDEQGKFHLDVKKIPVNAIMRVSMIGYNPRTFAISDLIDKENEIRLESKTTELKEIIVKPLGKPVIIGSTQISKGILCGWEGTDPGKGYEIGTELKLGEKPVRIKSLHLHLHKQSFDSTLFRLHIRSLIDNMPGQELLSSEILIKVEKESGWIDIDLSRYNLVFEGDIVLSLEWIKAMGLNNNRLMKMNGQKQYTANVLFSEKKKEGCIYTRWGSEAIWSRSEDKSPCFYITVQ